ncbi:hypothetical protein NDU88_011340 [Pleurodeles waltl]|uniref:Uncharacterized protein n=1 Tax=Pleurodeles waltl TaxID=8319 RepID=A0AAV7Q4Q8_PLEWA|nr:hypothetical protein NDU88_011340 [Pleurodeles waltl]
MDEGREALILQDTDQFNECSGGKLTGAAQFDETFESHKIGGMELAMDEDVAPEEAEGCPEPGSHRQGTEEVNRDVSGFSKAQNSRVARHTCGVKTADAV